MLPRRCHIGQARFEILAFLSTGSKWAIQMQYIYLLAVYLLQSSYNYFYLLLNAFFLQKLTISCFLSGTSPCPYQQSLPPVHHRLKNASSINRHSGVRPVCPVRSSPTADRRWSRSAPLDRWASCMTPLPIGEVPLWSASSPAATAPSGRTGRWETRLLISPLLSTW